MNPWIAVLNDPPKVTKADIERAKEIKKLIQLSKRYNLPLKYQGNQ